MGMRIVKWGLAGCLFGLTLGAVIAINAHFNVGSEAAKGGGMRALPLHRLLAGGPPGASTATGEREDAEVLVKVAQHISVAFLQDRRLDKAIQYIDAVDDREFRDNARRWLAMSIVDPFILISAGVMPNETVPNEVMPNEVDEGDGVPADKMESSKRDIQAPKSNETPEDERRLDRPKSAGVDMDALKLEPRERSPQQKKDPDNIDDAMDEYRPPKPEDFKTATVIAESIKDPLLKAETLSAIAILQGGSKQADQRRLAETNLQQAMNAVKAYFVKTRQATSTTRVLRAAVWPTGFGVLGLILGIMCVPLIRAYGEAVGRSLAKEIRSDDVMRVAKS
jgi:hypothetical protein